ncbi:MAG: type IV toxin-antitoxin system AbiEi family antitoxin domain-containing protein [Chlamydiia bacterium]
MFLPKLPGGLPYLTADNLQVLLQDHKRILNATSYLVERGQLIRLKRGFFVLAHHPLTEAGTLPMATIANLLYGPSYVSKQWILSYRGVIPEFASTLTSMSLPRGKLFDTPIGRFDYCYLNRKVFHLGLLTESIDGFSARVATNEKALLDWLAKLPPLGTLAAVEQELVESMRIEPERLRSLDKGLVEQIAMASPRPNATLFSRYLHGL